MTKPRISSGAMTAATTLGDKRLSSMIERAMIAATEAAAAEGISDPAVILERKQAARAKAKAAFLSATAQD